MKILDTIFSVSVACGIVFAVTLSSAFAQESNSPTPKTSAAQSSPGATQSKSTTATAQRNQFRSMDANKDGRISATEYRNTSMATFLIMDKDRDGKVSSVELTDAKPSSSGAASPFSSAQMGDIDADKDSQISSTEASDGAARMFKNLDINKNGFLSVKELNGRQHRTATEASAESRKTSVNDEHKDGNKQSGLATKAP